MSTKGQLTLVFFGHLNEKQLNRIIKLFHAKFSSTAADLQRKKSISVAIPTTYNELRAQIKYHFQMDENVEILTQFDSKYLLELRNETYCLLNENSNEIIRVYTADHSINNNGQDSNSHRYSHAELDICTLDHQLYRIKICYYWSIVELKLALKREWPLLSNVTIDNIKLEENLEKLVIS